MPQFVGSGTAIIWKCAFGYPIKIATNPLAVELESENDNARKKFWIDSFH
jgi:hypothetical protein